MGIPFSQVLRIGSYILGNHIKGTTRYPLVLMLEPLFRCNLACQGCGKIDYPKEILNQRLSYDECMQAIDECGAPVVSIAGGEPLLHRDMPKIVKGALDKGKFVICCTNALLFAKKVDQYEPRPNFTWSIHLDGDKEMHDRSVSLDGVYETAEAAIRLAKSRGFQVSINCTLFNDANPERTAKFFDRMKAIGIDGITVSPGYAYERAANQDEFLNRTTTKNLFRNIFRLGKGHKWPFNQSIQFLNFLAGNETYKCTPWGNPTRTVFGWQRPCYLLGEDYAKSFKDLMENTAWDDYGVGNYEKCQDCMVHSGFEATAVIDTVRHPLKAAMVALKGIKTEGPMAPDISLANQRRAKDVFSDHVQQRLAEIREAEAAAKKETDAA
ncbi:MAG: adenosyl-hopene transferase HpnH [Zymomonas mobilis]|uniref:adenosyl-hopene transferase HpnH n=1 Tax=Zymomonas mobilis TaxID=542 RepID=UPI0039E8583C